MSRPVSRLIVVPIALVVGLASGAALGLMTQDAPPPGQSERASHVSRRHLEAVDLPPPRPLKVDTLLAWTPGGLPEAFAKKVRTLPGVDHAAPVTSGTAWLTRSVSESGATVDRPPRGLGIPVEVAAADLSSFAPFLPPPDRSTFLAELSRGRAVLGKTSARVRSLGAGGRLVFGKQRVGIAAVVADSVIGAHEAFVSLSTAAKLGVTRQRYLLIDPSPRASRHKLTARITELLPPGALLQVRGPGETPYFRYGDAVLPPVKLKQLFGEFAARPLPTGYLEMDQAWSSHHLALEKVPILGVVRCNRGLIPQLRGALEEVAAKGLVHLIDPSGFGGCYSPRFINANPDPHGRISHHTWGVAVDVNVPSNPYGRRPSQDQRLVTIFERWGFTWGGDWLVPDGMHFEFVRFASGS